MKRIMVCVTSFNEDPDMVKRTLVSAKASLHDYGDLYLLDDSTNYSISMQLKKFCLGNDIKYVHRSNRHGYKAGAINNVLFNYGHKYDLIAIFDSDQRPIPDFFYRIFHYFNDKNIAFVQVPQSYTEIKTPISKGATAQQEPFLHIVMRGRNLTSAFSLGSGTVYRIDALLEVGGIKEDTVTEDIATSVLLHDRGYGSVYADFFGVWYGEPPQDALAYVKQQGRWSLGGFQLLPTLLRSNLKTDQFSDYLSGYMYWLKAGPVMLAMLIAPIIFMLFRIPFLKLNLFLYILIYYPLLFITIATFIYTMKDTKKYSIKSFYLHQCVEILAFPYILISFINSILGKKKAFNVTPKGNGKASVKVVMPHIVIDAVEIISVIAGALWYLSSTDYDLKIAILLNIIWSFYFIIFITGSITIAMTSSAEKSVNIINHIIT
ncbi:MAG: glycosyltransferase family 2 protein [Ferroplasma sp.]